MPLIVPKDGVARVEAEVPIRCTDCGFTSRVSVKTEGAGIPTDNPEMLSKVTNGILTLITEQMRLFIESHQGCPEHKDGKEDMIIRPDNFNPRRP